MNHVSPGMPFYPSDPSDLTQIFLAAVRSGVGSFLGRILSNGLHFNSFLLLVVRPGATSSFLFLVASLLLLAASILIAN